MKKKTPNPAFSQIPEPKTQNQASNAQRQKPLLTSIRKRLKLIAAFLAVNFLTGLAAPNVAYALTAGPTAPDYTSFEPVDTSDLVNLLSGDLAYNLPLLEVPGPAGGYPLSLSYQCRYYAQ